MNLYIQVLNKNTEFNGRTRRYEYCIDHVAAWTIGGLVAGKILAKA